MPSISPSQPVEGEGTKKLRRFRPDPVETSAKSNRPSNLEQATASPSGVTSSPAPRPRRRFAPQLIETTQRSRKSGDTAPALLPADKTNISPGDQIHLPRHLRIAKDIPIPPVNTPTNTSEAPVPQESRFSSSSLQKQVPRRHSFRVPDLASIVSLGDSEESGDSKVPSLSTSPSAVSDETEPYKHATRIRESCDDTTSGYLLALAARAAEKQLREQAMAAYPNEHDHEPVDHFAFDRDSDSSDLEEETTPREGKLWHKVAIRRESTARWNMDERRRHREGLDRPHEDGKSRKHPHGASLRVAGIGKHKARDIHDNHLSGTPKEIIGGHQNCDEVAPMRKAASPPMLGEGLVFPKSESPQPTMLMVGSYPGSHKGVKKTEQEHNEGLWTPGGSIHGSASAAGLWNGVCNGSEEKSLSLHNSIQKGLLTPLDERDDPLAKLNIEDGYQLPLSPPSSQGYIESVGIDQLLIVERQINEEYHDSFVTQVYNYLSLGYPSLARRFDDELSKITKVSVEQLRRDDARKNTKGYVGAPEGRGSDVRGVQNGECARWLALRSYIREWARQQVKIGSSDAKSHKDWGAAVRKGSWAF